MKDGSASRADDVPPLNRVELRGAGLPIRVTQRTTFVLRAINQRPRSSNRAIAQSAGLIDEGQASRLLARLERHGLIENVGIGAVRGEPNAWLLTHEGRRLLMALDTDRLETTGTGPSYRKTHARSSVIQIGKGVMEK